MSAILEKRTDLPVLIDILTTFDNSTWDIDAVSMAESLSLRVRGQDHVISDLAELISRSSAKVSRQRPIANLMFVGPTGTGKSELCKAMAEYLFGNENNVINYDGGALKSSGVVNRLVGSPQGYQGAGGELTKAMLANKKRLVVFDEIEKANPEVYDLFLSMMGDGRLQDQRSGKAADFTESIIVMASNAEQDKLTRLQDEATDANELNNALRVHLSESGTFRPEIIGRIDRIYVFKPLEGIVRAEIVMMRIEKIAKSYGVEIEYVDPNLIAEAVLEGDKLAEFGSRQRDAVVEDRFGPPILAAKRAGAKKVRLSVTGDNELLVEPALYDKELVQK